MSQLKDIKISNPTYRAIIPSTKGECKYRAFRVGDEKTLLMAAEAKDGEAMVSAIKEVIENCVEGVKVESLAPYDLEYLFIKLRSVSVGEIAKIKLPCSSCEHPNEVEVDLSQVEVVENSEHTENIKLTDDLAFKMKYPDSSQIVGATDTPEAVLRLVSKSVDTVFYGENSFKIDTPSDEKDVEGILNQLTTSQFSVIQKFFTTMPKLSKELEFVCESCGETTAKKVEGLASFF